MNYNLKFVKISNEHQFAGVGFAGNIFITLNALSYTTDVTVRNIKGAVGEFDYIKCIASSGRPTVPTTYGAYLGNDGTQYSALEL